MLRIFSSTLLFFGCSLIAYAESQSEFVALEHFNYPSLADELFLELQNCIEEKGFVDAVSVTPKEDGATVSVWVSNRATFPISGLIVQSKDQSAKVLGLDGPSIIEFDALPPNDKFLYSEFVPHLEGVFSEEAKLTLSANDILDLSGSPIVKKIFWTRWPRITSAEELAVVYASVCESNT